MCTPGVGELTLNLLETYKEQGFGVSFKGLQKKWNEENDVADVVKSIEQCKNLKYFGLEGNTLGVNAAKAIGKGLESKTEFEAALWKDLFTGRLKHEIPQAMNFLLAGVDLAHARLQYLDLSDNAIGPLGMAGLSPFFKSDSSFSLKVLICTNNGLGPTGAGQLSKALIDCRKLSIRRGGEVFNLKKFICGRNRMQNKGATAIAKFIKECDSLEEIQMHENSIYHQAQLHLAEAFLRNPNLRVINLNDNTIVGKGLRALSASFQKLQHLEDLNLGDCLLKNVGAITIVNCIKDLPKLQRLNLEGNEINKAGGMEIAAMLRNNKSLQSINFSANGFGTEGTELIGNLIRHVKLEIEDMESDDGEGLCLDDADEEEEEGSGEEEEDEDKQGEEEDKEEGEEEDDDEYEDEEDEEEENESEEETDEDIDPVHRVIQFLEEPTVENYRAIPTPGLAEYLYDMATEEREPYWLCIEGAVDMVQYYANKKNKIPEFCETIFTELMTEAARYATAQPNEFATCLLINMGIFRGEEKKFIRNELCDTFLHYLRNWLIYLPEEDDIDVPRHVLACLKNAFEKVRPELNVNKAKLATLIDSVMNARENLAAKHN